MMKKLVVGLLFCFWMVIPWSVRAEEITVAVAANFTTAMRDIVAQFEKESGNKVNLAFGSSGKIYAQIRNGAPFQAFFSADQAKPTALTKGGEAIAGSQFTYAIGALALWSAKPAFVDAEASVLKQGSFNKLALANPKLAPYGAAAVDVLKHLGLEKQTQSHWVLGENISQTYQFVASENADIGFVALSQIMDKGKIKSGSAWLVPATLYSPIRQDAVLLSKGEHSAATKALLAFVKSAEAKAIIQTYGYKI